jgi:hypothetical protein
LAPKGDTDHLQDFKPTQRHYLRQAAGLLLHLWDLREEKAIREVFQRFQLICEEAFSLRLAGEDQLGGSIEFDPRIHEELREGSSIVPGQMVLLRRPGVLFEGADMVAILPALVEQSSGSSKVEDRD